ncbi:MAG: 30S ribosomal protein S20 [Patescibacteria group bacterium]
MPNKANARKALRQAIKKNLANNAVKKSYRAAVKNLLEGISAGGQDIAEKVKLAQKKLDKAAKKGVIKSGTASRRLSRLMKRANQATKKQ